MAAAPPDISEVWASNLYEEIKKIAHIGKTYPYIAMDTKFSGLVNRPANGAFPFLEDQYQVMRSKVDMMKLIQLGLTFMNADGEFPPGTRTWQFNFKFHLIDDEYSQDSINQLRNSGVQFERHQEEGIEMLYLINLLNSNREQDSLVVFENAKWITFHSGFDFGYLVKLLMDEPLPEDAHDFLKFMCLFFPIIYDVRYLMESCSDREGDMQNLADQLKLVKIGQQHQAGADSALIGMAFFRIKELYFEGNIDERMYSGRLYELVSGTPPTTLCASSWETEENNSED